MINRLGELQNAATVTQAGQSSSSGARGFRSSLASLMSPVPSRRSSSQAARASQGSPLLGRRSPSQAAAASSDDPLQRFISRLEEVRQGPMRELEAELVKCESLHANALHATIATAEKEALAKVELCAERASTAAQRICTALQALAAEVDACMDKTEARIRKLQLTRVSALFQDVLNTYYQAQQSFRREMEAKVSRQLRVAFPEADDVAVAAVAAHSSAASVIQGGMRSSPSGASNPSIALALLAAREKCDELECLATAARELRQRFVDVEIHIMAQGEAIDDIGQHVDATRTRTQAVIEELERANALNSATRCRCFALSLILIGILVVALLMAFHSKR